MPQKQQPTDWQTIDFGDDITDWQTIGESKEKGYLEKWEDLWFNKPLLSKETTGGIYDPKYAANYYDPASAKPEDQWRIPEFVPYIGGGTYRSLGAGLLEGAGDTISGLTTPLNLATLGTFKGASTAAKYGLPTIAKGLGYTGRALSGAMAGSGTAKVIKGAREGNLGEVGFGAAEVAGGLAGMMAPHAKGVGPSEVPPFVDPNRTFEQIPRTPPTEPPGGGGVSDTMPPFVNPLPKPRISAQEYLAMKAAKEKQATQPPSPPSAPVSGGGDHIIEIKTPSAAGNALLRQQGYEPYGISKDGYPQMILRGKGSQPTAQPVPTVPDIQPIESGSPFHEDEGFLFPKAQLTDAKVANLKSQGWQLVGTDAQGNGRFKRMLGNEQGSIDFTLIAEKLRRMFGREPTPEEVNKAAEREVRPGEETGRVAPFSTDERTGVPSTWDKSLEQLEAEGELSPGGRYAPPDAGFIRPEHTPMRLGMGEQPPRPTMHPYMSDRIESAAPTGVPWDFTEPTGQQNLPMPLELHQRNQLEKVGNAGITPDVGMLQEPPVQGNMLDPLVDQDISSYLRGEDATPPEGRDLSFYEKAKKFIEDERGSFDPEGLRVILRRMLGREPTDAELIEGMERQAETDERSNYARPDLPDIPNPHNIPGITRENVDRSPMDEMREMLRRDMQNPPPSRPRDIVRVADELAESIDARDGRAPELSLELRDMIERATDIGEVMKNLREVESFIDTTDDPNIKAVFENLYQDAFRKYHETIRIQREGRLPPGHQDIEGTRFIDLNQAIKGEDKFGPQPEVSPPDKWDMNEPPPGQSEGEIHERYVIDVWARARALGLDPADYRSLGEIEHAISEAQSGKPNAMQREELAPGQRPGETIEQRNARWAEDSARMKAASDRNKLSNPLWREIVALDNPKFAEDAHRKATELIDNTTDKTTAEVHVEALEEWMEEAAREDDFDTAAKISDLRVKAVDRLRELTSGKTEPAYWDWESLKKGSKDLFKGISERVKNSTAKMWAAQVEELDARNAPDYKYRDIMSTAGKNALKRGETWRGRVIDGIKYFVRDEKGAVSLRPSSRTPPPSSGGKKGPSVIREAYNLSRGATTTADLSASMRQGFPLITTKAWWTSWKQQVAALGSEGAYQKTLADIKARPLFQPRVDFETGKVKPSIAEEANVKIMDVGENLNAREEATASNWVETGGMFGRDNVVQRTYKKTAGRIARASNRAYTAYLNQLRADSFEALMKDSKRIADTATATGEARRGFFKEQFTPEQATELDPYTNKVLAKQIGDTINTLTGRGPLRTALPTIEGGKLGLKERSIEQHAKLFTDIFFSPRLIASRVRMLNPMTYMMADPFIRKQYLKGLLSVAGAWGTFATLGKIAGGDINTDTNSADFGKVRFGNVRLDPAAGFQQYLVAASRLITGKYTSSARGTGYELGQGIRAETRGSVTQRFATNKLHPVQKFANDIFFASQYRPVNMGDRVAQMFTPLIIQDVIDIAKEDPTLLPLILPAILGMGTQTYEKGETKGKIIPSENDWIFEGGAPNMWQ